DVELPPTLIAGLDVQDRQLVVEAILVIERVEQLQVHNALGSGRLEHRVEQVDRQEPIRFAAEEPLEDVIDLGINPRHHDRSSLTSRTAAEMPAPRQVSTRSSFSSALPRWGKGNLW